MASEFENKAEAAVQEWCKENHIKPGKLVKYANVFIHNEQRVFFRSKNFPNGVFVFHKWVNHSYVTLEAVVN